MSKYFTKFFLSLLNFYKVHWSSMNFSELLQNVLHIYKVQWCSVNLYERSWTSSKFAMLMLIIVQKLTSSARVCVCATDVARPCQWLKHINYDKRNKLLVSVRHSTVLVEVNHKFPMHANFVTTVPRHHFPWSDILTVRGGSPSSSCLLPLIAGVFRVYEVINFSAVSSLKWIWLFFMLSSSSICSPDETNVRLNFGNSIKIRQTSILTERWIFNLSAEGFSYLAENKTGLNGFSRETWDSAYKNSASNESLLQSDYCS